MEPKPIASDDALTEIEDRLKRTEGVDIESVQITPEGVVIPVRTRQRSKWKLSPGPLRSSLTLESVVRRISKVRQAEDQRQVVYASIAAVVPTYETEEDVDVTVESLLLQSRQIDQVLVIINGPGESDAAYQKLSGLAAEFPERLKVERPVRLNGRRADGSSLGSKVGALNYAYWRYLQAGSFDFMLGLDADVEADRDMVHHLEVDLIKRVKTAGVMARYSFKIPRDMKKKSLSLVHGQRHEFAVTGMKQQLRGYTSEILGGQATLFRVEALRKAADETDGKAPWDTQSLVEDAELTRTLQKLGYATATSSKARAWTGLMYTANAWQKQRRKWQDGHLTDMIRDFHPVLDFRRWRDQLAMGWNLVLRVLFAVTLAASIALDQFVFYLVWLVPIGLAVLQSFLVALKIPNRTLREVLRALMFIPGELYYVRTLSVWLDSVMLAIVNIRRDGWGNQARAEESTQVRLAISGWVIMIAAVAVPMAGLFLLSSILPAAAMGMVIMYMWYVVLTLTAGSVLGMVVFIFRMLRRYRTLAP